MLVKTNQGETMSQNQNPEGAAASTPEATAEKSVSYESHKKLLDEKKRVQKEHEELRARLDQYEQDKLEAEGKLKELNEKLKTQLSKSNEEKAALAKTVQEKVIKSQFARKAQELGCVDINLAYQAIDLSDVDVTNDLELDETKLTEKLNTLTKEKHFLFKKEVSQPNDLIPNSQKPITDMSKLSEDQLIQLI